MPLLFSWLLNAIYATAIVALSPWILWSAVRHGKYREGFAEKLLGLVPSRNSQRSCLWLHAVSVGEVNLLATLIDEIESRDSSCELVISTTTKTGYDLARRKYARHTVCYCPLDFSWATSTACRRIKPDVLVLAELELWPNLIRSAKQHGAQVAIVNGRLSDNSFRGYRRFRPVIAQVLGQLDLVAAQDETTADRFRQLGVNEQALCVTGSVKFDGAQTDRENHRTQQLRSHYGVSKEDRVLLAGSTQAPEEAYALRVYQQLVGEFPRLRLVVVPRHPERFDEVAHLLEQSGLSYVRRSELDAKCPESLPVPIILVDTIGELGAWWGLATVGFVGGSFGSRGGQNMLEPAAYGVATCFGPNTKNFRDIVTLLLADEAAQVVTDYQELESFVRHTLEDSAWAEQLGARAQKLVVAQQGAVGKTADRLLPLLGHPATKTGAAA